MIRLTNSKHLATISASILMLTSFISAPSYAESKTAATSTSTAQISKEQQAQRRKINQHLRQLVKNRRKKGGWLGSGELPPNVKFIQDLAYVPNTSKSQTLDLYLPEAPTSASSSPGSSDSHNSKAAKDTNASKDSKDRDALQKLPNTQTARPLVIWIHGGGWRGGDKKGGPMQALLKAGFAVASINYRLSGEAKWPAQLDDCRSAVAYLDSHASEYGIDAKRIALWGASAGGHLVLMLALKDGTAHGVKAVCDWFGPTDLVSYIQSTKTTPNGMEMIKQLLQADASGLLPAAKDASPITFIKKDSSLPALLIVHGKEDPLVPVEQSENLAKQLTDLGYKDVKLSVIKGGHGYPGFGADTVQDSIGFLQSTLK